MNELESMFLRFGRSSWSSEIDPKRPQERIKNNFEVHRTQICKKRGKKDDKKRQYELSTCFDRVWPDNAGPARKRRGMQFGRLRPLGSPMRAAY